MRKIVSIFSVINFILLLCLGIFLFIVLPSIVGIQTYPFSDKARTWDLLNIHEKITPNIPIVYSNAKIVFFSDLHIGMGERDFFKDNRELFRKILEYYYVNDEFILVLLGDIEEGWGFQSDNVPTILQWHKDAYDIEKKFAAEGRYYRVFGNHDDYYRSNPIGYGNEFFAPVYPAVVFYDEAKNLKIFATHGCQGHGFHDAGDQVAAWGVFARYNWILEILPKKEKEGKWAKKAEKIKANYDQHEQYLYDWANNNNYDILVAGHTHRPIFESNGISYAYEVLKRDINNKRFPLYIELKEPQKTDISFRGKPIRTTEISEDMRNKMISQLDKEKSVLETAPLIQPSFDIRVGKPTRYFNPGCGYLSEIPCIEIYNGQVILKYYRLNSDGQLDWQVYDPKKKTVVKGSLF